MPVSSGGGRYSQIPAWAVDDTRLSLSSLRMLVLLGTYSNRQAWCWPSQEEMAGRLGGISQQAVSKAIGELEKCGYIVIQYAQGNGFRRYAKYKILMDNPIPDEFNRNALWQDEKRRRSEGDDPTLPTTPNGTGRTRTTLNGQSHTTGELSGNPPTTEQLSAEQPSSCMAHNSPVVENQPTITNPNNKPNSKPKSAAPLRQGELSADGRTSPEWIEAFIEGCYASRGVKPDLTRNDFVMLNRLRLTYPVAVVIAYHEHLKAQPFWEERAVSIFRITKDIAEWKGLREAKRKAEADATTGRGAEVPGPGPRSAGGDGPPAEEWDDTYESIPDAAMRKLRERQARAAGDHEPPTPIRKLG